MNTVLDSIHPGEVLEEEFLKPLGLSQYRLAQEIDVPARRINEIVHQKRSISADTAVRLASFFGTSEMFWMNLQARFELDRLAERRTIASRGTPGDTRRAHVVQSSASTRVVPRASASARAGHSRNPRKTK